MPEHSALLVLEPNHGLHGIFEHGHNGAVLVVHLLVHALQNIHHRNQEPAHGPQPEVGTAPGLRIGPVHLTALVVTMIVKTCNRVFHVLLNVHKLPVTVLTAHHSVIARLVFHVEGLCHVGAVQPNLPRINVFVPEIPFLRAGLGVKLGTDGVNGITIPLLAGQVIESEQIFALIDIVQIVLFGIIGVDHAAVLHEIINETAGKFEKLLILGGLVQAQTGGNHTSVNVIPFVGLAAAHLFNIPQRGFGGASRNQVIHIVAQGFHNFLMRHDFSPPQTN